MITLKKFYMIRHGQSVANEAQIFSGNLDVALTDLGRTQAAAARLHVESLTDKPVQIIHSHLQRARHTAEIINENLKLPLHETSLLGEHHFGDWENQPWEPTRAEFHNGIDPPNGETHDDFATRVQKGINHALSFNAPVLIACHGGIFRAFYRLYNNSENFIPIQNCVLYEFTPDNTNDEFPWIIKALG